jgi:hypothetical protein
MMRDSLLAWASFFSGIFPLQQQRLLKAPGQ